MKGRLVDDERLRVSAGIGSWFSALTRLGMDDPAEYAWWLGEQGDIAGLSGKATGTAGGGTGRRYASVGLVQLTLFGHPPE